MIFEVDKVEEQLDEVCPCCSGKRIDSDGEKCSRCDGTGMTTWPKRCGHNCQTCDEIPPERYLPRLKVRDMFEVDSPGIRVDGKKGVVRSITYTPCRGFNYTAELGADKTHFNTNDGNFDICGQNWKKIGREKTLMEFGDINGR